MRFKGMSGLLIIGIMMCTSVAFAQDKKSTADGVIWEAVDIPTRDLFLGPGGSQMAPDLKGATLVDRQTGGNNLKYKIRDKEGNEWIAKMADESQPETAAVRLLWGVGYKTEINYLIPKLELAKVGRFHNVRLEARPKGTKRDRWMWTDNPFVGTKELDGLKIMMAMFNNWDLKDENNAILTSKDGTVYVISDLGASFGKLANAPQSRSGRSVNDPEDYAKSVFIKDTSNGMVHFAYTGMADHLIRGIKVEHARWLADLLLQLSDKQINDAFRAANYKPEDAAILTTAFKARISALDQATRGNVVAEN